jgi:hypothetical protein
MDSGRTTYLSHVLVEKVRCDSIRHVGTNRYGRFGVDRSAPRKCFRG